MQTITINIKNDDLVDKVIEMLKKFKDIEIIKNKELVLEKDDKIEIMNILQNDEFLDNNEFKKKFNL